MLKNLVYAAGAAAISFVALAFVVPFLLGLAASFVGGVLHTYAIPGLASLAVGVLVYRNVPKVQAEIEKVVKIP